MTPARGPSVAPTKPYTLPAWLKRWVSRTKVQAMSKTPMVASVNARGTARPTVLAVACGLMLAAIEGAIRASEMPTASHRCNSRRRCGLSVLLTSVDIVMTPLLGCTGIRSIEGAQTDFIRTSPVFTNSFPSYEGFLRRHAQYLTSGPHVP